MRKIVFITGTRADFGKLKPLITILEEKEDFQIHVFVTGMHLLSKYGSTVKEVERTVSATIYKYINQTSNTSMDIALSNTIVGFSNYVHELRPDLIVVHGDRIEPFAAAIVGSLNNILVAHVEGGEISGTIDELIRHAISKLSHVHFVSNDEAKKRLLSMGEELTSIFVIGSPDIEIMRSQNLPKIVDVKERYNIEFDRYGILLYHPVTTELSQLRRCIKETVDAMIASEYNFVVIYPNNDKGSDIILNEYSRLRKNKRFKILPSMRFEFFLSLLKNANFILGNSSAGIREAEVYGTPTINLGNRQKNRSLNQDIIHVSEQKDLILSAFEQVENLIFEPKSFFDIEEKSSEVFLKTIQSAEIWKIPYQKQFIDS
ncbi:UDP-N-acetylglucosamine 2-epimerase [Paenibacillus luteus]|uniref:UDP-N-acetylglucosamine 2-epimerase n=1 Tax=Paenibacillus luteus TaxID=2545753 RepID=UPI0011430903|nr:UDP-N-acetylglucosamine 2-epimerase [Paenibacillus luteus]